MLKRTLIKIRKIINSGFQRVKKDFTANYLHSFHLRFLDKSRL